MAEPTVPASAEVDRSVPWHALDSVEVEARLHTDVHGLSADEARSRFARFGPNQLEDEPPTPALVMLLRQFRSPLIILVGATIVTVLLKECGRGDPRQHHRDRVRQDRHAHREPHDGSAGLDPRAHIHGPRRWWRGPAGQRRADRARRISWPAFHAPRRRAHQRGRGVFGRGRPPPHRRSHRSGATAMAVGIEPEQARETHRVLAGIPFEPERRYSASLRSRHGDRVLYVKGAPERVVEMCAHMLTAEGLAPIDEGAIHAASRQLAADGLRVLPWPTNSSPHRSGTQPQPSSPNPTRSSFSGCRE